MAVRSHFFRFRDVLKGDPGPMSMWRLLGSIRDVCIVSWCCCVGVGVKVRSSLCGGSLHVRTLAVSLVCFAAIFRGLRHIGVMLQQLEISNPCSGSWVGSPKVGLCIHTYILRLSIYFI